MKNWMDVAIYDENGCVVEDDATQAKLMREYRDTKSIVHYWLADPTEWTVDEDGRQIDADGNVEGDAGFVDIADAGPKVTDIDWSGLE